MRSPLHKHISPNNTQANQISLNTHKLKKKKSLVTQNEKCGQSFKEGVIVDSENRSITSFNKTYYSLCFGISVPNESIKLELDTI